MIEYVDGDATRPRGEGSRVIVHVCNDAGRWGKGFVVAISKRWKEPERDFRVWHEAGDSASPAFRLGSVRFVEVESQLWVANLIGQHGIRRGAGGVPPVRYDAIREGLLAVARFASGHAAAVHMPRIGCGLERLN